MFSMIVGSVLLGQKMSFSELEKTKYEAMAKTTGFQGRYDVSTLPSGNRQSVYIWATPSSKRIRVIAGGLEVVESAWTKDRKWLVNHATRQYKDDQKPDGFAISEEYRPLSVQAGRANFSIAEMGPRFAADPEPVILKDEMVTEEGKKLRRVEAVGKNASTNSEVIIIQLFDENTYIVRRFSMEISTKGKQVFKVNGFLNDSVSGEKASVSMELPKGVVGEYQLVSGSGG